MTTAEDAALFPRRIGLSVHAKRKGTVEIRIFIRLPSGQDHRAGTLCVPSYTWAAIWKPVLVRGAHAVRVELVIDDSRAHRAP